MNKKWMSRVLAIVLALCMVLAGMVFAEEPAQTHVHELSEPAVPAVETTISEPAVDVIEEEEAVEPAETIEDSEANDETEAEEAIEEEEVLEEETSDEAAEEESVIEEEVSDEAVEEEPVIEEEVSDEAVEEEPVIEEEVSDEAVEEEPVIEEEVSDEAVEEEPVIEEEVSEEATEEEAEVPAEGEVQEEEVELPQMTEGDTAEENTESGCTNESGHQDGNMDCICDHCQTTVHGNYERHYIVESPEWKVYNANYHVAVGKYVWKDICACGADVRSSGTIDEDGSLREYHNEDGEDGSCSVCGFKRAESESCSHSFANGTCGDCLICGEWLHFIENCKCTGCGMTRHEGKGEGEGGCFCSACGETDHGWVVSVVSFTDATYTPCNNDKHYVSGNAVISKLCQDCKTVLEVEAELGAMERQLEDHDGWDSCSKCGFARSEEEVDPENCPHVNVYSFIDAEGRIIGYDNRYEYYSSDVYEYFWCEDCGADLEPVLISTGEIYKKAHGCRTIDCENHLSCPNCGMEASCIHDGEFETVTSFGTGVYVQLDSKKHVFKGQVCDMELCVECGWERTEFKWKYGEIEEEHCFKNGECVDCGAEEPKECKHNFDDGPICSACGAPCEHKNVRDGEYDPYDEEYTYESIDGAYHWQIGVPVRRLTCDDCWTVVEEEPLEEARIRKGHVFYDWDENDEYVEIEACRFCGYKKASCAHANTFVKKTWLDTDYYEVEPVFQKSDAEGHHFTVAKFQDIYCADCDEYLRSEQIGMESYVEPHDLRSGSNICECYNYYDEELGEDVTITYEFACEHPNLETRKVSYAEAAEYATSNDGGMWWGVFYPIDEETHILYTAICYRDVCPDCGATMDRWDLTEAHGSYTAPHEFEDGYCINCNEKQPVVEPDPTTEPTVEPTATPEPTQPAVTDEPVATPTVEPTAAPEATPTAEPTAAPEPTQPAVTDEPIATASPAPTAKPTARPTQPVVEDTPAATQEPAATEAPAVEIPAIESETASIVILNVEKVLTVEEKKAMDTLPVKEQLLSFLIVIGFEEQVGQVMAAEEVEFSAEAVALQEEIKTRLETMTEEEQAVFQEMLLESFPTEVVVIDGVEHTMFILEIEVTDNGVTYIERYGLEYVDGEWSFVRL